LNPILGPITKSRRGRVEMPAPATTVRVAIYTRQSVEDRTASGFTSLEAQRDSALAYIGAMKSQCWEAIDTEYTDSGFSGGNTERPALNRLLTDIQTGQINVVIVYRLDRLSRSLLDFLNLLKYFEQYQVSFVSVTEQLNTATPAGRLMTSIIGGFAEYERAVISERTSDKMCAARRKGKWMGGPPCLGYNADRENKRLVVNQSEAVMVRELFDLYLQHRSLIDVCRVVNERGWTTKTTTYKNGRHKDGVAWNKARLYDILANVTYIGKVLHKGELYLGEQEGIVNERAFAEVQKILQHNSQNGGASTKNKHGALLRGLLKCGNCGAAMSHTYAKKRNILYRYYMCVTKMKRGADACPTESLPAQEIEDFVVNEIRKLAKDPDLQRQVFEEAARQQKKLTPKLEKERKRIQREVLAKREEIKRLVTAIGAAPGPSDSLAEHLTSLESTVAKVERRVVDIDSTLTEMRGAGTMESITEAFCEFDGLWDVLTHSEQTTLISSLVESIGCNGPDQIHFHLHGSTLLQRPNFQS